MAFTRTRIWRYGIASMADAPAETQDAQAQRPGLAHASEALRAAADSGWVAPAHSLRGTLPGFELPNAARESAATRVLPIEQLFPALRPTSPVREPLLAPETTFDAIPAGDRNTQRTARLFLLRRRHWQSIKIALAVVIVALLGFLLLEPDPASLQQVRLDATDAAPAAPQPLPPNATPTQAVTRAPEPPQKAGSAPQPGLERAAVNALIAGDLARAQSIYADLARTRAAPSAYSEALRILAARQQRQPRTAR